MAPRQPKQAEEDNDVAPGTEAGVKLPGGIEINTKGYHLGNLLQIVAAAILVWMGMMLNDLKVAIDKQTQTISVAVKSDHDKLAQSIEKGNEAQLEMNYILTLSPADRERLNLRMPDSLRRKLVDGR